VLSLLFALAQIVAGVFVARRIFFRRLWRKPGPFVLLLIALWFVCSGIAELFVSGMEAVRRLHSGPDAATFNLWRGRADTLLLAATILLFAALLAFPLARRATGWRRKAG
jgi:hypothetical protein